MIYFIVNILIGWKFSTIKAMALHTKGGQQKSSGWDEELSKSFSQMEKIKTMHLKTQQ